MGKLKSILLFFLIFFGIFLFFSSKNESDRIKKAKEGYTYAHLINDISRQNINELTLTPNYAVPNSGVATVTLKSEKTPEGTYPIAYEIPIPCMDYFVMYLHENFEDNPFKVESKPPPKPSVLIDLIPILITLVIAIIVLFFVIQQVNGGGSRAQNFGKSRARVRMEDKSKITFEQVAGLDEEKTELYEIVDFLKNPKKYTEIGARIPKGVLLVGPPGTGKTYLARAVAGESDVPFFSISGSDFVEMFVGVGASRVRDLFEQAKRNPASIVIIDEIDAVGRRRGAGLGGGHDEREQTLNQLLVEMDGFGANEGVVVLAATNRPDILDPALLRPGRFDRRIVVNKPDTNGREAILHVHAKGKQLAGDVSLRAIAQTTSGFTPADLESLLNESALLAARQNKKRIDMEAIRNALIKVGVGTEKKSRIITESQRRITAYHEAGHAICHEVLPDIDSSYIVSVIPTGMALGYVLSFPEEDRTTLTRGHMKQEIVALLGGRAAESLVLNDITTGASNDIERATGIARSMVVKYGMSEALGPIQFGSESEEVFIGRDLAHQRNYGEGVAAVIDNEIKRMVEEGYIEAQRILEEYKELLHKVANLLLEKERVSGEDIRKLFPPGVLKEKNIDSVKLLGEPAMEK